LREDEDPLEPGEDLDLALAPAVEPETPPEGGNEGGEGGSED
jgi:segregation and condensation protein B